VLIAAATFWMLRLLEFAFEAAFPAKRVSS